MDIGNYLVATGLCIVFVAPVFEFLTLHLSGLAVGTGLVILGFLSLGRQALTDR